jgi:hypothetical protein
MNDWDDLRFFLALAQTGSLSMAARLLAVKETLNNSIFHDPSSVFLVRWEKKAIFGA